MKANHYGVNPPADLHDGELGDCGECSKRADLTNRFEHFDVQVLRGEERCVECERVLLQGADAIEFHLEGSTMKDGARVIESHIACSTACADKAQAFEDAAFRASRPTRRTTAGREAPSAK